MEANPLEKSEVQSILQQASLVSGRKAALGLDSQQLAGIPAAQKAAAGHALRPGEVAGNGPGYFKLSRGREGQVVNAAGIQGDTLVMQRPSDWRWSSQQLQSPLVAWSIVYV